jgi:hypothetical protein
LEAIEAGATFKLACELVSITEAAFCLWRRGDPDFAARVDAAAARGDSSRLKAINRFAAQDWRAPAWLLERRRPTEYGRQAAQINVSANAAAAVGVNGKPPTVFEAMVLSDLDFIKLSNHPDYSPKQPVLDGVPPELTPPLQKNGESTGYVISESLAAIDKRMLEQTGRTEDGPLQNITGVTVSDIEFLALCGHPLYERHPALTREDGRREDVPPELSGSLARKDKNIVVISQSKAEVNKSRLAEARQLLESQLKARGASTGNDQTAADQAPLRGEPSSAQVPAVPTANFPTASAPSEKPASWWRPFIFGGAVIPKVEAILAVRLILDQLRITVD